MIDVVMKCFEWKNMFFFKICDRLRYGLTSSKGVRLEEMIGMFLIILGHGVGTRVIEEQFQHSGKTMNRQFHFVLEKMMMLAFDEIKPPENYVVPHYIQSNRKYWPYVKDCIRAIDGTHIRAKILVNEQIPYIGRKGFPTQNIMAACDFNMLFKFVWLGWEGSAYDTRIFLEALQNPDIKFPKLPLGISGQPKEERETFNYVHSSLRSVIERCFGVWKARWRILADMPRYKFDSQVVIFTASMALHNFIRREAIANIEFESQKENENHVQDDDESYINPTIDDNEMGVVYDKIARELVL
ncbi:hypothetical protein UlMin_003224 [Ulmus minor]